MYRHGYFLYAFKVDKILQNFENFLIIFQLEIHKSFSFHSTHITNFDRILPTNVPTFNKKTFLPESNINFL